jgi:hypothetical protein
LCGVEFTQTINDAFWRCFQDQAPDVWEETLFWIEQFVVYFAIYNAAPEDGHHLALVLVRMP